MQSIFTQSVKQSLEAEEDAQREEPEKAKQITDELPGFQQKLQAALPFVPPNSREHPKPGTVFVLDRNSEVRIDRAFQ